MLPRLVADAGLGVDVVRERSGAEAPVSPGDTVAAVKDAKSRWIDEGIRVLSEDGFAGVRIDRIAARLGLSKGSFHHHFDGAEGYKKDLLARFEAMSLEALGSGIARFDDAASARDVLGHLTELIGTAETGLYSPKLDAAVRAWATADAEAREVQARIDAARLRAMEDVWRRATSDEEVVRISALLPYLILVGATSMLPPLHADDLRKVFSRLLPLVPDENSPT